MVEGWLLLGHLQLWMQIVLHPLSQIGHPLRNGQAENESFAVELFKVVEQSLAVVLNFLRRDEIKVLLEVARKQRCVVSVI